MTFDDDMIRLNLPDGTTTTVSLKRCGLEWPPPERLMVEGQRFVRSAMSIITDEERAGMTHVFRGAEYQPVPA